MAADVAVFPVDGLALAGHHDAVAALVFCTPPLARHVVIQGVVRVRDGRVPGFDLPLLAEAQRRNARALLTT
jgi:cytosine/adenosine deaminase-related metal-dependent hydrolase